MYATNWPNSNHVLDKPADMSRDQCDALSVQIGNLWPDNIPVVVSCWKFTQEELENVNRTGRLYLAVLGHTMPPVILSGFELPVEATP